jgi:hypothetical protein
MSMRWEKKNLIFKKKKKKKKKGWGSKYHYHVSLR